MPMTRAYQQDQGLAPARPLAPRVVIATDTPVARLVPCRLHAPSSSPETSVLQSRPASASIAQRWLSATSARDVVVALVRPLVIARSEQRRVGKECVRQCSSRWSAYT